MVHEMKPNAIIIANAVSFREVDKIYVAGADYVYLAHLEAAAALAEAFDKALEERIETFRNRSHERHRHRLGKREILN